MFRKLLKWTLISGVTLGVVGFLFFGKGFTSYASTAFNDVRTAVRENVSVDFELRRAKSLIGKIDPEILEARREVARSEVDLDRLGVGIRNLQARLVKGEQRISSLREHLAMIPAMAPAVGGEVRSVSYQVEPENLWRAKVDRIRYEQELARTFDLYRNQKSLLKSKTNLMVRQRQILEASRTKLAAVRSEKQKLEDMVTQLEARKRQLDALAATTHQIDLDDSVLNQAKTVLGDIQKRLDVKEKMIQEGIFMETGIASESLVSRDITSEVDAYFMPQKPVAGRIAPRAEARVLQPIESGR